MHVKYQKCR